MEQPAENHWIRRIGMLAISALLVAILGWSLKKAGAEPEKKPPAEGVVASIGDQHYTQTELEELAADQLRMAELELLKAQAEHRKNRDRILRQTLDQMIRQELLDREASTLDISSEELYRREVTDEVTPVDDEAIRDFYLQSRQQDPNLGPLEQLSDRIRAYLTHRNERARAQAYFEVLSERYEAEIYYESPRLEIASRGFPALGPSESPVTIVEFSDFECPYCSKVAPTLKRLQERFPEEVRVVFRQYPLPNHRNAQKAAEASLCADDQGQFWAMHDELFAHQRQLNPKKMKELAQGLELDAQAFDECLDSGRHFDQVQADLRDGALAGVTGTPALFINGKAMSGAIPFEELVSLVEAELL